MNQDTIKNDNVTVEMEHFHMGFDVNGNSLEAEQATLSEFLDGISTNGGVYNVMPIGENVLVIGQVAHAIKES